MAIAGPTNPLAGTPCRPSDGPSAQRAGRVKAAAAHPRWRAAPALTRHERWATPDPNEHSCSSVAVRADEGPLTEPTAVTRPWRRLPLFTPDVVEIGRAIARNCIVFANLDSWRAVDDGGAESPTGRVVLERAAQAGKTVVHCACAILRSGNTGRYGRMARGGAKTSGRYRRSLLAVSTPASRKGWHRSQFLEPIR